MSPSQTRAGTVSRRAERRRATTAEIKEHARRQLAEMGPGGLSLRRVARDMHTASSALYRYFPSQDDLINALVADAYASLADALTPPGESPYADDPGSQLCELAQAFRQWALENRGDFTLIFGTPIPGYEAPEAISGPGAGRALVGWISAYVAATRADAADPARTEMADVPEGELLRSLIDASAVDCPPELAVIAVSGYLSLVGVLVTEIFGSLDRLVDDPDALYRAQVRTVLLGMGFHRAHLPDAD